MRVAAKKIAAAVIRFANRFGCLKNQRPLPVAQLARAMLAAVANQAVCGTQIYEAADIWKLVE